MEIWLSFLCIFQNGRVEIMWSHLWICETIILRMKVSFYSVIWRDYNMGVEIVNQQQMFNFSLGIFSAKELLFPVIYWMHKHNINNNNNENVFKMNANSWFNKTIFATWQHFCLLQGIQFFLLPTKCKVRLTRTAVVTSNETQME